jgi:predicted PurR-regulated permease PerM
MKLTPMTTPPGSPTTASEPARKGSVPPAWAVRGLLAIAIVFLLHLAQPLLMPVLVAVAFTFVLAGPVRRLRRMGIPEAVGAGIVVASVLSVMVLGASTLAEPAAAWWDRAPSTARQLLETVNKVRTTVLGTTPARAPKPRAAAAEPAPDPLTEKLASEGVSFGRVVLGQMLSFTIQAAAVVILLYFLLASEHWLVSRTVEAVPRRRTRALVLGGIRQAQHEIGLYLGTMTLINLVLGALTAALVGAIGLPNPVLWGSLVAVLNFVPYLLLAGSVSFGADVMMLAPPAIFLGVHAIESNFVTPLILGRRLRLSPLSVFLSVMFWGWMWGIVGALIAVPILLGLRAVCKRSKRLKLVCVYLEGDARQPPSLHALLRKRRGLMPAQRR